MKKIFIYLLLLTQVVTFAQRKTRADRYFEKGDYTNAARNYEKEFSIYGYNKEKLQNIVDCYYNTFEFRKSKYYLQRLLKGNYKNKEEKYDNIYNFKMHQVLSALGNHEKAVTYLKKYKEQLKVPFNTKEAVETIEEFKLKNADYTINNLRLNTNDNADFGAVVLKDSLYFVSDRTKNFLASNEYQWTHKPYLDIYKAAIKNDFDVDEETIEALPKEINSKLHEGNFCFNKAGTIMYVSRSNISKSGKKFDDKKVNNVQLFKSEKIDGKWTPLQKLPFCEDGFSYQHPALNENETELYFSANLDTGFGSYDIYYVAIDGNHQNYGDPINVGEPINTPNREHFPYLSKEGNLFFASNGHLGLGMLDNFVSEFKEGQFSKPINLGTPINSKYDDFNLIYTEKNKGYFASNRNTLSDDIYGFTQTGEIFEREYLCDFEVRDSKTKEYIEGAAVVLLNKKSDTIYYNTLDALASFTVNIKPNKYKLIGKREGYISNSLSVKTKEGNNQKYILYLTPEESVKKKPDTPTEPREKIELVHELINDHEGPKVIKRNNELYFKMPPIYFEFDKWTITKESKKVLDGLARKLEKYPTVYIQISAHTDARGTIKYNQYLSERRAESTRNYLALEAYINARRMQFVGFGELKPIFDCKEKCTEEEHQQNRRSEFKIISY